MEDPAIKTSIQDFYGLRPDLHVVDQLITRSLESTRPKRIYFVSRAALDLVVADEHEQLKITSLGIKVGDPRGQGWRGQRGKESLGVCSGRG